MSLYVFRARLRAPFTISIARAKLSQVVEIVCASIIRRFRYQILTILMKRVIFWDQ